MAANFQQMGMGGQMMQQRQQQQQQQQQRPPQGPPSAQGQIQNMIYQTLNQQTGPLSGWQAGMSIQERMALIFNLTGNLRLASQNSLNPPDLNRMIQIGIQFEKSIFEKSPNKEHYKHEVQLKLEQLAERRAQNQGNMQQSINQQAQAQAQAQAQQMMMNQNNMQGQVPRPTPQPAQQGFSHLQHQMQASPLPGQQPQQQAPMGMPHQGLPPNMTPNQQQQFQMAMQQSQQSQAQQNVPGRQPNGQQQMSAQDTALIMDLTNRLMAQASDEEKNTTRASLQSRMDPQQLQKYQTQGLDPLFLYYRNQAMNRLRSEKQARLAQAQQLAQQNNIPGGAPMQQQRSMNPSPLNGQSQPPASMTGNADFGAFINMENLAAQQQQQGQMAQEAGQMVVPVSGAPRNGTPQPGVMSGQAMNMGDQRGVANPNPRVQQQQQILNAQQVQQQRLQHAQQQQQQQSQVQARLNAQAKAQQLALQGQPGGMGSGPMPPQQSPAMGTLNTPLRTPSQQMNPEPPQVNPNAQFGQPLDPRFMQGNRGAQGQANGFPPGGLHATMFASMGQEQQQRLATLPPDKLNEVVNKWNEQRQQQHNGNLQAARPQMPIQQVPGQVRPGPQVPQPNQFNPQNAANQFVIPNGQRTPQNMAAAMNSQQLLVQQQMAAMRNPMQQRAMQQNMGPNEQRTLAQMDAFDIPQAFRGHASMPQGIPPDVKKWGQLKQWVGTNQNLGPDILESMKQLQRLHYQSMLRSRNQAQSQAGQMQPGVPGGQIGMPTVPPGLAAPVAPMGQQHPMQMPNGMNVPLPGQIRQPTPQEIVNIRNHPSGKMAQATDDQIRNIFMRNQMQQQQQQMNPQQLQAQQQRALLQMQMQQQQQRMNQQTAQQPQQLGQPLQIANSMPGAAGMPAQIPQQKQPQPGPEPTNSTTNTVNASRAARPPPGGRNQAQNSSPAQPAKSLKRASSDDVIEIPRPANQPPPQPKQSNQQARVPLSREQVAALDPEKRAKYEAMMRGQANQASQANTVANGANQSNANRAPQLNPEQTAKYRAIQREEEERGKEPLPPIPMDAETKAVTEELLKAIVQPLNNVGRVVPRWFLVTLDEQRTRAFFRARLRLAKQFRDGLQMTQLRDTFSITPKEIESTRQMLNGMVADLSARFPNMKKQEAAKSQSSSSVTQSAPQTGQSVQAQSVPTPLNAANLQQQQQQLNKLHQRSNSRASHTPAAPTSTHAPFQIGATSPHGAPSYIGKTTVTQDNLHLPPSRKKQKQNAGPGQGTPGSTSSPQVTKAASPEVKRQPAESKAQLKPSLCCSEPECDRHTVGFDNEEDLKHHTLEEHVRPLENPEKFAKEELAAVSGLDSHGQAKKATISIQDSTKMVASGSKQGQAPNVKTETTPAAGTPMNRQASVNRQGSAASARPNAQSKSGAAKDAPVKSQAEQKDSSKQAPQEIAIMDPWANATIDPHDLQQSFQPFETGAGGAISDINVYRSITPNDTPESSKDGVSEPNSDISEGVNLDINVGIFDESWMPFGASETDALFDINSFNVNNGDDLTMFDDDQQIVNFQSWEDMVDTSAFDKSFSFDTSLYSMHAD